MRAKVWIDHERQLVVTRVFGERTSADMLQLQAAMAERLQVPPHYARLSDFSGCPPSRMTRTDMARLGQAVSKRSASNTAKRALVASDDAVYARCREFEGYAACDWPNADVFRNVEDACRWLELPPDYVDQLGEPDLLLDLEVEHVS